MPEIPNVPYLDVVAAMNDANDTLTLFCVNRDLSRDLSASISIRGFVPAKASAQVLYSSSIYDQNDEVHPEAVRPRTEPMAVNSPLFSYIFRHESVTVIQLKHH